jgi:hypothetical protein
MLKRRLACVLFAAAASAVALTPAAASQRNERTIIKISDPVMIPGATLQPGTYVFKLVDSDSSRHMVQVLNEDGTQVIATTIAVPAKRQDPNGNTILRFNPTEGGTPAIKAWFYPGTLYGHEFVYSDREARDIAQRTKTVVLATDVPESDMDKGTLYVYDASGRRGDRQSDVAPEWEQWYRARSGQARAVAAPGSDAGLDATAPMMAAQEKGMPVKVDDLEENAARYSGKLITVDAEVGEVLGPRLFTIDEPNWADLDGEILVFLPANLAAIVREDDRVTVTGTMKPFVRAEVERELGWLDENPTFELELAARPVLIASRIVGGNNDVAVAIVTTTPEKADQAVGTSGTQRTDNPSAITQLDKLAGADENIVGRRVQLEGVTVASVAARDGFWLRASDGTHVFVRPASDTAAVDSGRAVSIEGIMLQMPDAFGDDLEPAGDWNDDVYVYATKVN